MKKVNKNAEHDVNHFAQILNGRRLELGGNMLIMIFEDCGILDGASYAVVVYEGDFEDHFIQKNASIHSTKKEL